MFRIATQEEPATVPLYCARPRLTNEQRLILTNAEQVLQEFCLNWQIKSGGHCDGCPLYLAETRRCVKGIVGQAKHLLRCPQSTTEEG